MVTHTCTFNTTACMLFTSVNWQHFTIHHLCKTPATRCTCCKTACSIADLQAALGVRNHSTQEATAKIQRVRLYMRCQIKHAGFLPTVSQVRVEEACLLVYEGLNLSRAFLRHLGLAQLTTPPSVLGHNLPQHHSKAVDINLHHSWQAGHAV